MPRHGCSVTASVCLFPWRQRNLLVCSRYRIAYTAGGVLHRASLQCTAYVDFACAASYYYNTSMLLVGIFEVVCVKITCLSRTRDWVPLLVWNATVPADVNSSCNLVNSIISIMDSILGVNFWQTVRVVWLESDSIQTKTCQQPRKFEASSYRKKINLGNQVGTKLFSVLYYCVVLSSKTNSNNQGSHPSSMCGFCVNGEIYFKLWLSCHQCCITAAA